MKGVFLTLIVGVLICITTAEYIPRYFSLNQFYPTKGERDPRLSETKSSGAIRDVIKRNSPRFRKVLVRNANQEIVFHNEDARLMTSRAKSKLDILASLTQSRWNIKIRVLKAWTDDVSADLLSLHYEGRAIRVRTNDNNNGRLSDLAKLALKAGFDWVHYKDRDYIHISVIPDVCQTKLDLAIVVDTSGSVGIHNFNKIKSFLNKLIDFFNIGIDETHIALISYSYSVKVEFPLNRYYNKWDLKQAINRMWYQGANTATGNALIALKQQTFTLQNGMRDDKSIPKIGILMTDGYSNGGMSVAQAARQVKAAGINMFVVGITNNPRRSEINAIASPPIDEHYVAIARFTDLSSFVDQISTVSCDEGAQISQCENADTDVDGGSFKYFRVQVKSSVTIEVQDKQGQSFLYASFKLKNPGPLSQGDIMKNENPLSPRTIPINIPSGSSKIVYIAVQGQKEHNQFSLSIWDSLFPNPTITKTVDENQSSGVTVTRVQTKISPNMFKYSIKDGNINNHFQIDSNSGVVKTKASLDREKISKYQLSIIAQDENEKCHKGLMVLIVYVGDKDDNKPKFEKSLYTASVWEDVPQNQYVVKVQATDQDVGSNAKLTYEIYEPAGDKNVFQIDPNTGVVRTRATLDYETRTNYELKLRVSDGGNTKDYGYATLKIQVQDVNEPPYFTQPPCILNQNCLFTIKENKPAKSNVGQVIKANDPDTRANCRLEYHLVSLDNKYFTIGKTTGVITTKQQLDRETKETYSLDVRVSDCGTPRLSAQKTVIVKALDENDNHPVFPYPSYTQRVPEDKLVNSRIVKLTATDLDAGANARITYSISKTDAPNVFNINPSTGEIVLKRQLDRETKAKITLEVTATDGGSPSKSTPISVVIIVTDVNDNRPAFSGPTDQQVKENVGKGTHVFAVTATDADEGLNKKIRFSIVNGNTGGMFKIFDSGRVETSGQPDREKQEYYTLKIRARDFGSPSLYSDRDYRVQILDENDNTPVFSRARYIKTIKENAPQNSDVIKVRADDADIGTNAEIVFSIDSGNDGNKFSIDASDGLIKLVGKLEYGTKNFYRLRIKATDKGTPRTLTGTSIVDITVQDTNDFKPVFSKNQHNKRIDENIKINTPILKVLATDQDSGTSGQIIYTITRQENDNAFYIDSNTGQIFNKGNIDYETRQSYLLTVTVTDKGVPAKFSTATVNIQVNDLNDNTPVMADVEKSILEDKSVNFVVHQLVATDKDSGDNKVIEYTLITTGVPFAVSKDGRLTVSGGLDRETQGSYTLTVRAQDKGAPSMSSTATVVIRLDDVNDNIPVFGKNSFDCSVFENAPINTHVCYVKATDQDIGINAQIKYSSSDDSLFKINVNTGEITTAKIYDREVDSVKSIQIKAQDQGRYPKALDASVGLTVTIKDENDNTPEFGKQKYTFKIKENENDGTDVGDVGATDKDTGSNADIDYTITSGHIFGGVTRFSIVKTSNNKATLKAKKLDRETRSSYSLTIRANDRGTPSLSSTVVATITVDDLNDNKPIFTENVYTSKIKESVGVGTYVLKVSASDRDAGSNAEIAYKFTSGTNQDYFSLDVNSGVLTTAKKLDYETIQAYSFTVTAEDKGSPKNTDTAQVNIEILNVDDNAPKFENISQVELPEDIGVGQPVVQFKATDKDGSTLTFSIIGGNTENKFVVDRNTGLMSVNQPLDRETTDFYNVTVQTSDGHKTALAHLPVKVLDVNDNQPIFSKTSYSGSIDEDASSGTFVFAANKAILSVHATDRDLGTNAEIVYSIVSGGKDDFSIAESTGEIRAKGSLDREEQAEYNLKVMAADKGSPTLRSVVMVSVKINDLNDNSPQFEKSAYSISIAENTGVSARLLAVKATDEDEGENGRVTYEIVSGSTSAFRINDTTGEVFTKINLDRETKSSHQITIKATDHGVKPLSNSVVMTITVTDMNDNSPIITSPTKLAAVNESSPKLYKVGTIQATDRDIGVNRQLVYGIQDEANLFGINPNSGEVYLTGMLDRENKPRHLVTVTVHDKGVPQLHATKSYNVIVQDANDNKPEFKSAKYAGSVEENKAGRNKLFTVKADDKDIGENAIVSYSIVDDQQGLFEIDQSGQVFVVKETDFETKFSYLLTIKASDWKFDTTVDAEITIIDVNDNNPIFVQSTYTKVIAENSNLGASVLTVAATDVDPFGDLIYYFDNTAETLPFDIDSRTGVITVAGLLDYEDKKKYTFKVMANDSGTPQLTGNCTVTISISDVNDNQPEFSNYTKSVAVKENQKAGTFVATLTASDKDSGLNGVVKYYESTIGSQKSKDFEILPDTGEVKTIRSFDREVEATLQFVVYAIDQGKDRQLKSKEFFLTVNILDENDNSPIWKEPKYKVEILESAAVGEQVISVKATDIDQAENGRVSYEIVDISGKFGIEADSGVVYVKTGLDRETRDSYTLKLIARDNGTTSRSTENTLNITILDVNDNSPLVDPTTLTGHVFENKPGQTNIVRVKATDRDIGTNAQIMFSMSNNDLFSIDAVTGRVQTLRPLDREEKDKYNLEITVYDKGVPRRETNAILNITVLDVDDNCPKFAANVYNANVEENADFGTFVLQVSATDADIGTNAILNYGVFETNGPFTINQDSGNITVAGEVDLEYTQMYYMKIRAGSLTCGIKVNGTNVGEGGKTDNQNYTLTNVYVTVIDKNDNSPVFRNGKEKIHFNRIDMIHLITLNATDDDSGPGGEVAYRLAETKKRSVSGKIENYVVVEAYDHAPTPLVSNQTLVVVNDIRCDRMLFEVSQNGNVTVKALCTLTNTKTSINLLVGETLDLECKTSGNVNDVKYRWVKDGNVVSTWSKSGKLQVVNVQQDQEGVYACVASSVAGVIQSTATEVFVQEKPVIVKQPISQTVGIDGTVILKMAATGDPIPTYQWYRDGSKYKGYTSNNLTLRDTIQADSGKYYCMVENSVGSVKSDEVKLRVVDHSTVVVMKVAIDKPDSKQNCQNFIIEDFEKSLTGVITNKLVVTEHPKLDPKFCKITACSKNPCSNGGTCSVTDTGFMCVCPLSWTGDNCERDLNECNQGSSICYGNSTCVNLEGSFACKCPSHLTGRNCEYSTDACKANLCDKSSDLCVASQNRNHSCVKKSTEVTLNINSKSFTPWNDQNRFVLEEMLNQIIKTRKAQRTTSRRKRRNTGNSVDFGVCTIHITNHEVVSATESKIKLALDCYGSNDTVLITLTPKLLVDLCGQLLGAGNTLLQCGQPGSMTKKEVKKTDPATVDIHVVIEDKKTGKALPAGEAIDLLEKKKDQFPSSYNMLSANGKGKRTQEEEKKNTVVIAVVVCLCLALVAAVAIFLFVRHKNQTRGKGTDVMHQRSVMLRSDPTSSSQLVPRGSVDDGIPKENLAYNDDDEEINNGTFMFEMPANLKASNKKTEDIEKVGWYHGEVSEISVEKLLSQCNEAGTYLLYKNASKEYVLGVKASPGGPTVHHFSINIPIEGRFNVQFGSMDPMTFNSVSRLIEYYSVHTISFDDDMIPDVVLTSPLLKSAL